MTDALPIDALDEEIAAPASERASGVDLASELARQQRARALAERAETELLALLHAAPTGIALFDRDLRYVRVNEALARMNGRPLEMHEGRRLRELLPASAHLVEPTLQRVLDTGEPLANVEVSGPRPDGEGEAHFLVSYYPIRVDGEASGVATIMLDITERKVAERRAAAIARLSTAFAGTMVAQALADEAARVLVDEVAASAWVVTAGEGGCSVLAAAHAGTTAAPLPAIAHELSSIARGEPAPIPDGVLLPMRVQGRVLGAVLIAPVHGEGLTEASRRFADEVTRHLALALDNAHLFEAAQRERERAAEASRTKDEFLAVVSHELRTPLNAMLGWATMLRSGALDDKTRAKAVEIIERNARAQAQLVDDILDLSRIVTGKLRVRVERLAVDELVRAAVDAVRPAAEAKGVRLELEIASEVGCLHGDPDRLQQVVWNLVSNAVKFTGAGGFARVSVRRAGGDVVLEVSDSGRGIPASFLPHVFDRFRQAESGTTRRHGGLGLGLAIVRHIVELHGGSAEVTSEGEGQGATFVVRLPDSGERSERAPRAVVASPASSSSLVRALEHGADLTGIRALVVDDEADARDLVASVLRRAGAIARPAADVEEALAIVRAERPDVIVTDIAMPGEDGFALVRRLRGLPKAQGGRTPAVALTAFTRLEDRTAALLAGFTAHLGKPVEAGELVSVVASIVKKPAPSRRG